MQQFVYVHKQNAIHDKKTSIIIMHLKVISSVSLVLLFQNSVPWDDDDLYLCTFEQNGGSMLYTKPRQQSK